VSKIVKGKNGVCWERGGAVDLLLLVRSFMVASM
jgi:hypothetical protein